MRVFFKSAGIFAHELALSQSCTYTHMQMFVWCNKAIAHYLALYACVYVIKGSNSMWQNWTQFHMYSYIHTYM